MDAFAPLAAPRSRWLTATNGLIAINIAVFLAMVASGVSWIDPETSDVLRWGADYGPSTLGGQYWRMITSGFVHFGIVHLLLNMWCLWSLGRILERLLGPFATVGVYLVTAAGASLLSLTWNPMVVGAGASGAIFGIAGAIIPILYYGKLDLPAENTRRVLGYVVRFSLINLFYGLTRANIGNMAHLGGLVTGLAVGLFLARSFSIPQEDRPAQRRTAIAVAAIAVVLLVIPVAKAKSYAVDLEKAETLLQQENYNSAIDHLRKYTAAQPKDAYGHLLLGDALQNTKSYNEAAQEYERALALHPGRPLIIVASLAEVYLDLNQGAKAVKLLEDYNAGNAPNSDISYWYARALQATGDLTEAEKAARKAAGLNPDHPEYQSLLNEIVKAEAEAKPGSQVQQGR
jgi:rhomboid protease GluP